MVLLGEIFPNFTANSDIGQIKFHEWIGDSWAILFSHPNDFTPVCTTELARVAKLIPEFEKRSVKVIALSCNSVKSHIQWIKDIKAYGEITEANFPYPIIEDESRTIVTALGMLDPDEVDSTGLPVSARSVFIIDPKKKMRLSILYPATTGRNFDEILRVIDSLQLTDKHKVATPVDWKVIEMKSRLCIEEAK
ncbi:peroxiredoxin-6 isoform X2 [Neodiprion virginianus]|uniref:thioredoxin-dependent peroxiredoxin n=1 Tax=Neodiprion lecontei TaxID=441921 RepID=A0ABM3FIZ0_NEOLC|nr:peroxiredoxin-6 isoform X2 [Neodiprion pinetum]XP_046587970.1 peroxiredoxin-6 isoform X2 [Neodiprion lecontei]XP_046607124.1 peroxiredoxin-6 isoform X2 [Neodiprion virginianus]